MCIKLEKLQQLDDACFISNGEVFRFLSQGSMTGFGAREIIRYFSHGDLLLRKAGWHEWPAVMATVLGQQFNAH